MMLVGKPDEKLLHKLGSEEVLISLPRLFFTNFLTANEYSASE